MNKDKLNKKAEKIFTIGISGFTFLLTFVMIGNFVLFGFPIYEKLEPKVADGKFKKGEEIAYFHDKVVKPPKEPVVESEKKVLSAKDSGKEKWIEIDLSRQMLLAHEGDEVVDSYLISSGKWGRTPTGEFKIWAKLKYTLMTGGSKAKNTYYYLPNVPYTQYFNGGFGIHGTYWHNNFGHPMSHGCINMYTPDAEKLFYWTNPEAESDDWKVYPTSDSSGTRVVIHGNTPVN